MPLLTAHTALLLLAASTSTQDSTMVQPAGRDPIAMQFVARPLAAPATIKPEDGTINIPGGRFSQERVLHWAGTNLTLPPIGRTLRADCDGDGRLDTLRIVPVAGDAVSLRADDIADAPYVLTIPGGLEHLHLLVGGDVNKDGAVDWYVQTTDGAGYLLTQTLRPRIAAWRAEKNQQRDANYATHVQAVHAAIGDGRWGDAVLAAAYYTVGWTTHSWKVDANAVTNPTFPWLSSTPATDCVIDLERIMAELHGDGTFNGFRAAFDRVQYYRDAANHKVRADFFEAESIPHWEQLGYVRNITDDIYRARTAQVSAPTFTAQIDKNTWYAAGHSDESVPFPMLVRTQTIAYVPWADLVHYDAAHDRIVLDSGVVAALPPVSVMAIVNQGRHYPKHGTDIAVSHTALLIKQPNDEVIILSASPITDIGAVGTVEETIDGFVRARVATPRADGTLDWTKTQRPERPWESAHTSIGLMLFAVEGP